MKRALAAIGILVVLGLAVAGVILAWPAPAAPAVAAQPVTRSGVMLGE